MTKSSKVKKVLGRKVHRAVRRQELTMRLKVFEGHSNRLGTKQKGGISNPGATGLQMSKVSRHTETGP